MSPSTAFVWSGVGPSLDPLFLSARLQPEQAWELFEVYDILPEDGSGTVSEVASNILMEASTSEELHRVIIVGSTALAAFGLELEPLQWMPDEPAPDTLRVAYIPHTTDPWWRDESNRAKAVAWLKYLVITARAEQFHEVEVAQYTIEAGGSDFVWDPELRVLRSEDTGEAVTLADVRERNPAAGERFAKLLASKPVKYPKIRRMRPVLEGLQPSQTSSRRTKVACMDNFDHMLIDGRNLLYRTAWANQMLSHEGELTGAVYGFMRSMLSAWEDFGKPRMHVCWEGKRNWRFTEYPGYKGNRKRGARDDTGFDISAAVAAQQPKLRRLLGLAGVPQWRTPDGECDDVMNTLARDFADDGETVAIYSNDRDMYQATADPLVYVLRPHKDPEEGWVVVDRVHCIEECGVPPEKVVSWKALAGDTSDNIPGVPKVGPKIAAKLVAPFDTLQEVLDSARSGEAWPGSPLQRSRVHESAADVQIYAKIVALQICDIELSQEYTRPEPVELGEALDAMGIMTLSDDTSIDELCSLGGPYREI